MERKKYIELAQRRSLGDRSVKVRYKGGEYYPNAYLLWYKDGAVRHTAVLEDEYGRTVHALLERVEG